MPRQVARNVNGWDVEDPQTVQALNRLDGKSKSAITAQYAKEKGKEHLTPSDFLQIRNLWIERLLPPPPPPPTPQVPSFTLNGASFSGSVLALGASADARNNGTMQHALPPSAARVSDMDNVCGVNGDVSPSKTTGSAPPPLKKPRLGVEDDDILSLDDDILSLLEEDSLSLAPSLYDESVGTELVPVKKKVRFHGPNSVLVFVNDSTLGMVPEKIPERTGKYKDTKPKAMVAKAGDLLPSDYTTAVRYLILAWNLAQRYMEERSYLRQALGDHCPLPHVYVQAKFEVIEKVKQKWGQMLSQGEGGITVPFETCKKLAIVLLKFTRSYYYEERARLMEIQFDKDHYNAGSPSWMLITNKYRVHAHWKAVREGRVADSLKLSKASEHEARRQAFATIVQLREQDEKDNFQKQLADKDGFIQKLQAKLKKNGDLGDNGTSRKYLDP